jgi:lincosamide nucleotidyltransferase
VVDKKELLLRRLDDIARVLAASGHGLALLALGSAGVELERLDTYSDLDFFVIVEAGHKALYLKNLDWLAAVHPIAYAFQNTRDGYKVLFDDGVFCENAIFEPHELAHIPFAKGRVIWQAEGFDATLLEPRVKFPEPKSAEWLLGETLTNLYVGMTRYCRGEKLSALRFVQVYAVEHVVQLSSIIVPEEPAHKDPFTAERRFEQRFPAITRQLPAFLQGYDATPASALAILDFLEQHFDVNVAIKRVIRELCNNSATST